MCGVPTQNQLISINCAHDHYYLVYDWLVSHKAEWVLGLQGFQGKGNNLHSDTEYVVKLNSKRMLAAGHLLVSVANESKRINGTAVLVACGGTSMIVNGWHQQIS